MVKVPASAIQNPVPSKASPETRVPGLANEPRTSPVSGSIFRILLDLGVGRPERAQAVFEGGERCPAACSDA